MLAFGRLLWSVAPFRSRTRTDDAAERRKSAFLMPALRLWLAFRLATLRDRFEVYGSQRFVETRDDTDYRQGSARHCKQGHARQGPGQATEGCGKAERKKQRQLTRPEKKVTISDSLRTRVARWILFLTAIIVLQALVTFAPSRERPATANVATTPEACSHVDDDAARLECYDASLQRRPADPARGAAFPRNM